MFKWLRRRKKWLFSAYVDLDRLKVKKEGSVELFCLKSVNDENVKQKLNELVDYIRDNYKLGDD